MEIHRYCSCPNCLQHGIESDFDHQLVYFLDKCKINYSKIESNKMGFFDCESLIGTTSGSLILCPACNEKSSIETICPDISLIDISEMKDPLSNKVFYTSICLSISFRIS